MKGRGDSRRGFANALSYLAFFLALGGTALAAATINSGDVVNNSLRSADLKTNAGVKGADIRNNSLRGNDIRGLTGANVATDSLSGADVNEPGLAVSQRVARLDHTTVIPLPTPAPVAAPQLGYTQAAGENNTLIGGGQVTFSAGCGQPRSASVALLRDNPILTPANVAGSAAISDSGSGSVSRRFDFTPFPGGRGMTIFRPDTATAHQFFLSAIVSCNSGSGVTLDSVALDVVAER